MRSVDLNADVGERFGRYAAGADSELLALVSSASIACGFHAGDPVVMRDTVREAAARGVAIGAHPGYRDLQGFGRRDLDATPMEIAADITYQVGALAAFCAAAGTRLRYVKPHGALYNRAARDTSVAAAIAHAIRAIDPALVLLGLANSALVREGARAGLRVAREAFVDRAYAADGALLARTDPRALLYDVPAIAARAVRITTEQTVETADGSTIHVVADSLCTHGDGEHAVEIVRAVRAALAAAGVNVVPFVA